MWNLNSAQAFAEKLYLEYLDEAAFRHEQLCYLATEEPNNRAAHRMAERWLQRCLDALELGGEQALSVCLLRARSSSPAEIHVTTMLLQRLGRVAEQP